MKLISEGPPSYRGGEHWGTDYAIWHRSISRFRTHDDLEEFSIRDIDKYLWMLAKERKAMSIGRIPHPKTRRPLLDPRCHLGRDAAAPLPAS
jgi:hypothetical protein